MRECPGCSNPVPDDGAFCSRCGVAVGDDEGLISDAELTADLTPSGPPQSSPSRPRSSSSAIGLLSGSAAEEGDFAAGRILAGRYRVVGLLGQGGMGKVYRADDLTLGQPVALKFLPDGLVGDATRLERFRAEVRVSRQVSHPNVCRVHDIGEADGKVFLSMELVDGGDLSSLLKRVGRLPRDKGLEIARQLCAGLAAAHDRAVLHRDLKPANVMIDSEGRVRIADFGLAGLAGGFQAGEIRSGTPAYMAPETLAGEEVTRRSDIYALGLVLYELFTGKPPFKADSIAEFAKKHSGEKPTPPSEIVPDLDPEIEKVLLQCLEKDPRQRPRTALAVSAMLPGGDPLAAMLAAGETPSPELVAQAGDEGRLSRPWAWALSSLAMVFLVAATTFEAPRQLLQLVSMERPPAVQLDRAIETLTDLGVSAPEGKPIFGFGVATAVMTQINRDGVSAEERDLLATGDIMPVRLWLRAAPDGLTSEDSSGRVGPRRPPREQPGEVYATFDGAGTLRGLEVVAPERLARVDGAQSTLADDTWSAVFAAGGLDIADFSPAQPLWAPPRFLDELKAWSRDETPHELGVDRVEAGLHDGRVVYLRTSYGFEEGEGTNEPEAGGSADGQTLNALLVIVVLAGGALLARRNVRLGRGDIRGAWRVAALIFVLDLAEWLVVADHTSNAGAEFGLFVLASGTALFMAAFVWLLYVALEPEVRRHWPRRLISWQRLVGGRYRDPLVGRHVLIGVVLGSATTLLLALSRLFPWSSFSPSSSLDTLGVALIAGAGVAVGQVLEQIGQAIFTGMFITVLVLLARLLLRRTWAAVGLAMVVFVGLNVMVSDDWMMTAIVASLLLGLVMFSLVRFGLLTLVAMIFTLNIFQACPLQFSLSPWYLYASLMPLVFLAVLAFGASAMAASGSPSRLR